MLALLLLFSTGFMCACMIEVARCYGLGLEAKRQMERHELRRLLVAPEPPSGEGGGWHVSRYRPMSIKVADPEPIATWPRYSPPVVVRAEPRVVCLPDWDLYDA